MPIFIAVLIASWVVQSNILKCNFITWFPIDGHACRACHHPSCPAWVTIDRHIFHPKFSNYDVWMLVVSFLLTHTRSIFVVSMSLCLILANFLLNSLTAPNVATTHEDLFAQCQIFAQEIN